MFFAASKKFFRRLLLEELKTCRLLSAELKGLNEIASLIAPFRSQIQGVTIVTHGFQFGEGNGDGLMPLASAVRNRADSFNGELRSAWLLDYDVAAETLVGAFDFSLSQEN